MFYSPTNNSWFSPACRSAYDRAGSWPQDAKEYPQAVFDAVVTNRPVGKVMAADSSGRPVLVDAPIHTPSTAELCLAVDDSADAAHASFLINPLRALEYERAVSEAQAFKDGGYEGDIPPMVAAWAIGGRSAQEAAESILAKAAEYSRALIELRETRLLAKEQIRVLMADG